MEKKIEKSLVDVVATAYVRATGEKIITRIERVDLTKDIWGRYDSWTETQVKDYYESYWNDWNPKSREIVKVDVVC